MNVYAKFPYSPLHIKKGLGIFQKGNNNPNNLRSNLGPFPGPKMESRCDDRNRLSIHCQ